MDIHDERIVRSKHLSESNKFSLRIKFEHDEQNNPVEAEIRIISGVGSIDLETLMDLNRLKIKKTNNFTKSDFDKLNEVRILRLMVRDLKIIPEWIFSFAQIEELDVNSCDLTQLPDSISKLKKLLQLDLMFNFFTDVPDSIFALTKLKYLGLFDNRIEAIPGRIQLLSDLEVLDLGANKLRDLPNELFSLSKLKTLNLTSNQLTKISSRVQNLSNLQILDLGYNSLSEICAEISNLKNLKELNVVHNKLRIIPRSIGQLKHLEYLNLGSNKIKPLSNNVKIGLSRYEFTDMDDPKDVKALDNRMKESKKIVQNFLNRFRDQDPIYLRELINELEKENKNLFSKIAKREQDRSLFGIMEIVPSFVSKNLIPTPTCFVLMPFKDKIYWDIYEKFIKPACEINGLDAKVGDLDKPGVIIEQIWEEIVQAKIIIANITGLNPNVMYELGLAHAIGKQVIILRDKDDVEEKVPFDIGHRRWILYKNDLSSVEELEKRVNNSIISSIQEANRDDQILENYNN